jgi:hypothetical protein
MHSVGDLGGYVLTVMGLVILMLFAVAVLRGVLTLFGI